MPQLPPLSVEVTSGTITDPATSPGLTLRLSLRLGTAKGPSVPRAFPKVKARDEQIADLKRSGGSNGNRGGFLKSADEAAPPNDDNIYDLLIIGAGATGAGVALDAATRGLKVAIVERDDFSSGDE